MNGTKRDAMFADADSLRELIVKAAAEAPESPTPLAAVAAGLRTAAAVLQDSLNELKAVTAGG
jgi:hypothetical protein